MYYLNICLSFSKKLPLILGDGLGHRIFALGANTPVSFMRTSSDFSVGFAVLTVGVHPNNLPQVLDALAEVDAWMKSLGGKRYLSRWLGEMTSKAWQNHYGPYYKRWMELKQQYEPQRGYSVHVTEGCYIKLKSNLKIKKYVVIYVNIIFYFFGDCLC